MPDLSRLSVNHVTLLEQCSMGQFADALGRHGIGCASLWRDKVREAGVTETAKLLADRGLALSGYCSGGLVTSPEEAEARQAIDEARRALDEAAEVKAPCLVYVAGAVDPRDKDIAATRARALERTAKLVPHARALGVKPVINSLPQARLWLDAGGGLCDLMVDTGMNRLGLPMAEMGDPLIAQLDVDTLLSHLASADDDVPLTELQRERWEEARRAVAHRRASLANSAGIALGAAYHGDLTRPGLALYGEPSVAGLALVISADNLASGFAGSAFIAYLSGLTNTAYTATQYALFSSLFTLPGKLLGGASGYVSEVLGWAGFFVYTSALGLPALLLIVWLDRRLARERVRNAADATQ